MKNLLNLGLAFALAIWTFIMGGFYALVTYGGDFIAWINTAFLGLAPVQFNTLVDMLQTAGGVVCLVVWIGGAVFMGFVYYLGNMVLGRTQDQQNRMAPEVDSPTVDGSAREL